MALFSIYNYINFTFFTELQKDTNCEQLHNITNGYIIAVDNDIRVNSTVYYVCDKGYSLRGPSSRTCRHYGVWSGSEPYCGESLLEQ